jgi:hypothetical protein
MTDPAKRKCVLIAASLVLFVWSPQGFCRQSSEQEPATRIERFLSRKNVLVIKEARFIGAVPGLQGAEVRIEAMSLGTPGERERVYGVRLLRPATRKDAAEESGIIDFDELASLQEALEFMLRKASEAKAPERSPEATTATGPGVEFAISTRGGVRASLVQTGRQFTGQLQVSRSSEDAGISFGIGALGRLRGLIAEARTLLAEMGAR